MRVLNPCRVIRRPRRERWSIVLSRGYSVCKVIKCYLVAYHFPQRVHAKRFIVYKYVIKFQIKSDTLENALIVPRVMHVAPGLSRCKQNTRHAVEVIKIVGDARRILNPSPLRNRCPLFLNHDRNAILARTLFGNNAAAAAAVADLAARIAPFARAVPKRARIEPVSTTGRLLRIARQGVDWLLGQSLNCTLASKVSRGLERGLVITQARISARCYDQPR